MSLPPRILCIGTHHKTGTVWMRRVWTQIAEALDIPFLPLHNASKWDKIPDEGRVIVVNWSATFAPEVFAMPDARFLHVIRDPRDVLLSGASYHETSPGRQERFLHGPRDDLNGHSYQEHLQGLETQEEKLEFEMENQHQRVLDEMLSWPYGHPCCFDLRYEDLIEDRDCTLFVEVLRSFGFDRAEVETARKIYFDNSLFGGLKDESDLGRLPTHVNSGKARQWPDKLPPQLAKVYADKHGADLIKLGYEDDMSWVADLESTPKTQGTQPEGSA